MKNIKEDKKDMHKETKKTDAYSDDKDKSFADKHSPRPSDNISSINTDDKDEIDISSAEGSSPA